MAENATTSEGRTTATTVANVSIGTPGFSMASPPEGVRQILALGCGVGLDERCFVPMVM